MIDPRTTNIVGERVRVVRRGDYAKVYARGVVRVVDYNQGTFMLLVESIEDRDSDWWSLSKGELFQVSLFDESTAVIVDGDGDTPA